MLLCGAVRVGFSEGRCWWEAVHRHVPLEKDEGRLCKDITPQTTRLGFWDMWRAFGLPSAWGNTKSALILEARLRRGTGVAGEVAGGLVSTTQGRRELPKGNRTSAERRPGRLSRNIDYGEVPSVHQ